MSVDENRGAKQDGSPRNISCNSCRYFYITWNNKRPYGCRAMGFISAQLPSTAVLEIEGRDCLSFERKDTGLTNDKSLQNKLSKGRSGNKKINVIV
tara:strand:- start:111 stop:398 length:288 start_codon:yes stop_codon:yes gene_type:complete